MPKRGGAGRTLQDRLVYLGIRVGMPVWRWTPHGLAAFCGRSEVRGPGKPLRLDNTLEPLLSQLRGRPDTGFVFRTPVAHMASSPLHGSLPAARTSPHVAVLIRLVVRGVDPVHLWCVGLVQYTGVQHRVAGRPVLVGVSSAPLACLPPSISCQFLYLAARALTFRLACSSGAKNTRLCILPRTSGTGLPLLRH